MKKELLKGLIAAPFTPMDDNGEIDTGIIKKYAGHLKENGVIGAFVCGTTGEGPSMNTTERKAVAEEWIRSSDPELKIIVHVGSNCQKQSIELAQHAQQSGAYAIASIAPGFFKPDTVDALIEYLQPIAAAASGLPFYYYHMPSMSGFNHPAKLFIEKAPQCIPNFAGIKYTHSDFVDMLQCIDLCKDRFDILNGFDELLICGLSIGAVSAVGSTYNFMPDIYIRLMNAFSNNDLKEAKRLQEFSIKIINVMKNSVGAIPAGKNIMDFIGISCGQCRPPLKRLTDSERDVLRQALDEAGFFKRNQL